MDFTLARMGKNRYFCSRNKIKNIGIMKHMKLLTIVAAFAAMSLTLASCDDDRPWDWDYYDYYEGWYDDYDWYGDAFNYGTDELNYMAQMLRGYWQGSLRNYYTDNSGQRVYADMDVVFEFDQYNSGSLNGRGRETDYVGNESQELRFSWYIDPRTGDINIQYDNSGYTFVLDASANSADSGFYLSSDAFSGVMEGTNNDELVYFDCERTTLSKPNKQWQADGTAQAKTSKYHDNMQLHKR